MSYIKLIYIETDYIITSFFNRWKVLIFAPSPPTQNRNLALPSLHIKKKMFCSFIEKKIKNACVL